MTDDEFRLEVARLCDDAIRDLTRMLEEVDRLMQILASTGVGSPRTDSRAGVQAAQAQPADGSRRQSMRG